MMTDVDVLLRLLLAAFLAGLIGLERELHNKPAGLRTHVLVGIGSTLYMIVSRYFSGPGMDPARVAAQVVTGIGFLGAGTIFRSGSVTRGLTTAASLWAVAGIGLAIGIGGPYGRYAVYATLVILLVLVLLSGLETRLVSRQRRRLFTLIIADHPSLVGRIRSCLREMDVALLDLDVAADGEGLLSMSLLLNVPPGPTCQDVAEALRALTGVKSAIWHRQ